MHIVDNFTGVALSRLTSPARLLIGGLIVLLAPAIRLSGMM